MLSEPLFADRVHAGRRLASELVALDVTSPVVLGLARGGVVVADEIATVLGAPLDAIAVRKVRHPFQPEYGIGAVSPGGGVYLRGPDGLTEDEVAAAVANAQSEAAALDAKLHARAPALDLAGMSAIVVDDGLATGATMIAGVRHCRKNGAAAAIAAAPVAARETAARLRQEADAVVCVNELELFGAVGLWYADFSQVSDEDVVALLERGASGGN